MKYFVVTGNDDCDLSKKINEYLAHGWQPQGGVSVVVIPPLCADFFEAEEPFLSYSQAVTHQDNDPYYPDPDLNN